MPRHRGFFKLSILYTAAFLCGIGSSVAAEPVDFSGKRIELIVSSQAGGGGDVFARGVAERLGRELPGSPTILVRNVPGGGTVTGANYFQKEAKPDGLTLFMSLSSHLLYSTFQGGASQIQFDPREWISIMGGPSGYVLSGSKVGGITTLQELAEAKQVTWGLSSLLGVGLIYVLGLDLMDIDINPVFNVNGSDATLGFQRGEFKLDTESIAGHLRTTSPLVESGEVFPLMTIGQPGPDGTVVRDNALPNVPHLIEAYEIIHGAPPTGEKFDYWQKLFGAMITNSRGIVLPAGTPQEIVDTYSVAIEKALTNPDDKGLETLIGSGPQFFGEEAQKSFKQSIDDLTPELKEWVTKWLKEKYNVAI